MIDIRGMNTTDILLFVEWKLNDGDTIIINPTIEAWFRAICYYSGKRQINIKTV